ncbi:MAG: hypothetical protein ACQETH_10940 [Candidatus Rifleibacteriota bacterium]
MKTLFSVLLAFALLCPFKLYACDTNLISLMSNKTVTDSFVENTSKLVELSVKIGKNISSIESARPVLKELMNKWISFDNNFSQYPPDWAKKDKNWKNKFKKLADKIGEINRSMNENDLSRSHNQVLEFSKNITVLFEYMPKSPEGERHYQISTGLQKLNMHYKNQDLSAFKNEIEHIEKNLMELKELLDEDKKALTYSMNDYIAKLKENCNNLEDKMNFKVKMALMLVEDSYKKLNEKLGNEQKSQNENNDSTE